MDKEIQEAILRCFNKAEGFLISARSLLEEDTDGFDDKNEILDETNQIYKSCMRLWSKIAQIPIKDNDENL